MAFAVNLLGAMVGGALEYLALLTGYRALLLVVAGLYLPPGCSRRACGSSPTWTSPRGTGDAGPALATSAPSASS